MMYIYTPMLSLSLYPSPSPSPSPSPFSFYDKSQQNKSSSLTQKPTGHIGWHTEAGLGMVFATRVDALTSVPAAGYEQCGNEGVERGMGPEDERWVGVWD
jgi:hypothetical protein